MSSEQPEKIILAECVIAIGDYIAELLKSGVGKTFFELLVLYSCDCEKRAAIISRIKFRQSLEYAQLKTVEYAISCVEKGIIRPKIPVRTLLLFVNVFIDGISLSVVFNTAEGDDYDSGPAADIPEMFQTLAKAIISFTEE